MTMPFYVAPEQVMKDRADYARKGIARGRSAVAVLYTDGILIAAENSSATLHKVSEIYDRIAFAGVGKYNEFDQLRIAGVRHADLKGYQYSREDVDARSLANAYAQMLGQIFTHEMKPMEVEILVAEVGLDAAEDQVFHILYDGSVVDEDRYSVIGGDAEAIGARLEAAFQPGLDLGGALRAAVGALAGPDRTLAPGELEVAVLSRQNGRRAFRRIEDAELAELLAAPEPAGVRPWRGIADPRVRLLAMDRRIFGLENEYGVTCTLRGQRRLSPDEVARYLFRRVVSWGRSSNVFLANGARLYLDVGSPPRVRHPRVRLDPRPRHPRQGRRADPRAAAGLGRAAPPRRGHPRRHLPLQEQHRLGRQQLRLPRELPHLASRRLRPLRRGADPVLRVPSDLCRRRQGAADRPRGDVLHRPAGRAHLGGRVVGHHPEPTDHQHARRAPRRRRALPPAPRDRRRLEHERVRHLPEGRRHVDPAAHARGPEPGAARPHAGEPDPGHPRDQPRHHLPAQGAPRQRPGAVAPSTSRASTSPRR